MSVYKQHTLPKTIPRTVYGAGEGTVIQVCRDVLGYVSCLRVRGQYCVNKVINFVETTRISFQEEIVSPAAYFAACHVFTHIRPSQPWLVANYVHELIHDLWLDGKTNCLVPRVAFGLLNRRNFDN